MSGTCLDIALTVNGETRRERVEARKTLVDFLRDDLGLTGSHVGCEHGVCGACTVRVDGEIVRGCLMLAVQCDGATVETIEGVSDSGEIADLQAAFEQRNALQCGFCTPGMLLTAQELLKRKAACRAATKSASISPATTAAAPAITPSSTRSKRSRKPGCTRERKVIHERTPSSLSMSERADELEEEKMHEMERIITKSTIAHLMDGHVEDGHQPGNAGEESWKILSDGRRSAPAADAGKADAGRLFPPSLRVDRASAAKRDARA